MEEKRMRPRVDLQPKEATSKEEIAAIIHNMDYARWDNPIVMKCFNMMRQLNNWLGTCYSHEHRPHVHVSAAAFGVVLLVGDVPVWDSENDDEEDLKNIDFCKARLKDYAMHMFVPFDG